MRDLGPEAFTAVYRCKYHAERNATAPIALRLCDECHEIAKLNYAAMIERTVTWRPDHDTTTWGEKIDESKVKKRKERLL